MDVLVLVRVLEHVRKLWNEVCALVHGGRRAGVDGGEATVPEKTREGAGERRRLTEGSMAKRNGSGMTVAPGEEAERGGDRGGRATKTTSLALLPALRLRVLAANRWKGSSRGSWRSDLDGDEGKRGGGRARPIRVHGVDLGKKMTVVLR